MFLILIHPAGKCSGQHLLYLGKKSLRNYSAPNTICYTFIYEKKQNKTRQKTKLYLSCSLCSGISGNLVWLKPRYSKAWINSVGLREGKILNIRIY